MLKRCYHNVQKPKPGPPLLYLSNSPVIFLFWIGWGTRQLPKNGEEERKRQKCHSKQVMRPTKETPPKN